jgi:N-acetyl-anhydromuramyl-L-alanine amidase AmpD
MLNIEKYGNFKTTGKQKKKKQIILCHTSREVEEYLTSLKVRYNSKYDKIPNYLVTKNGKILQLLPDEGHTNFFSEDNINRNSIIVCLENLGWLEKKPLTNYYINWKGSIYNQEVYEKKWRDFFFWEPYSDEQVKSTAELCSHLTEILKIKKGCIGHNTKFEGIEHFEGIVSKSNFDGKYTDLNPSFNFGDFIKLLENEQYTQ